MLTLQPKVNEWIVLRNSTTGRQVASIKTYLADGRTRLAFDIPKEIQVTRKSLMQRSAGNVKRT